MIEIKKIKSADFQFLIKSETGKILLKSISFSNEQAIGDTLKNMQKANSPINYFERKTNFEGKFLFEVKNNQGKIIGSSSLYSSEAGMENGIKNLRNRLKLDTDFLKL